MTVLPRSIFLALQALLISLVWVGLAPTSGAAANSGLIVIPRPSGVEGLSYFKLTAHPGSKRVAGRIELRNPTGAALDVRLSSVDGLTLSTLGSGYAPPGSSAHGSTRWIGIGRNLVHLAPGSRTSVPVTVRLPTGVAPGDFLSGVSLEVLGQTSPGASPKGVSIASASRYAIGVEVSVPGPRHPLVQFTGAGIERQPAGLTFQLHVRNAGNAILEGVHGRVLVSRGGRVVLVRKIDAGTFVSGTSISYPVTAFHQSPREGTQYHLSGYLIYGGGTARLNTSVTFGRREAAAQQHYGMTPPAAPGAHWWKIAGVAIIALYALGTTVLLLRRRSREADPARQT
jgi:hypothetical protein